MAKAERGSIDQKAMYRRFPQMQKTVFMHFEQLLHSIKVHKELYSKSTIKIIVS